MKPDTITPDILRKILIAEMALAEDRVAIYNPNYKIPSFKDLWIVVRFDYSKPYANRSMAALTGVGINQQYTEGQFLNTQGFYTISLMSRDLSALNRKEEVPMAFASILSQQMQESNNFRIAPIMPIYDRSQAEGAAMIFRFDINVTVLDWYQKLKKVDYYDNFHVRVVDDPGAPPALIKEFEQT